MIQSAIMAVRTFKQRFRSILQLTPLIAYGLAAPIATSLIGGGPAVMIWG